MFPQILIDNINNIYSADEIAFGEGEIDEFLFINYGRLEKLEYTDQEKCFNFGTTEAAILNYLCATNFGHVYCSETIIDGFKTTCLILDENKINENLDDFKTDYERQRTSQVINELKIERFPLLPTQRFNKKHRLLCNIRQCDRKSKGNISILIYSYSGLNCGKITDEGYHTKCNTIEYFDDEKTITRFLIFRILSQYGTKLRVIELSQTTNHTSKLEFFYNRQIAIPAVERAWDWGKRTEIKFNKGKYKTKIIGYNKELGALQKNEIRVLTDLISDPINNRHVQFSVVSIDGDLIIHVLLNTKLDFVSKTDYPILNILNNIKSKDDKILYASFRIRNKSLLFVSYRNFTISMLDETQNISTSIDSFFINGSDKMFVFDQNIRPGERSKANFLFYNDTKKQLFQFPIFNILNNPFYDQISIKKVGRFYYCLFGLSIRPGRRLVEITENFYFEYDFKNKEIIGRIGISTFDSLK